MFLIMGDEKYAHTIEFSVKQIEKIYPGKKVLLIDWGISSDSLKKIKMGNSSVTVKPWKIFGEKTGNELQFLMNICIARFRPSQLRETLNYYVQSAKKKLKGDSSMSLIKFEMLVLEKIKCFLFACEYFDEPFLFLDADAILVRPVHELFAGDADMAVTIRRDNELRFEYGKCSLLNSGVIYFGSDKCRRKSIVKYWLDFAMKIREPLAEQTALSRIVFGNTFKKVVYNEDLKIQIPDDVAVKFKILQCEEYNFNWVEELLDGRKPDNRDIRIVHFKGGRHARSQFFGMANKVVEAME